MCRIWCPQIRFSAQRAQEILCLLREVMTQFGAKLKNTSQFIQENVPTANKFAVLDREMCLANYAYFLQNKTTYDV